MKKSFYFLILLLIVASFLVNWNPDSAQPKLLTASVKKILDEGDKLTLYSIKPTHESALSENDSFHGFVVLGKTQMVEPTAKAALLESLYLGIENQEGIPALCFNPRHGIRVTSGTESVDLLICFECSQIEVYRENKVETAYTTDDAQVLFNQLLAGAEVPLAVDLRH